MTTRQEPSAGGTGEDRAGLVRALRLPGEPVWLKQVHGTRVVECPGPGPFEADASFTTRRGVICVAQAADCLPVLFCNDAGTVVAAAHAGWRGLCAGVLEATVRAMPEQPEHVIAWLGPAIGPNSFEVGAEVRQAFVDRDPAAAQHFAPLGAAGKYLADMYSLARQRLAAAGVTRCHGGGLDTYADARRFHSYRRDGVTGRQCALVWLA